MAKRYYKSDEARPVSEQKYKKSKEWNFPTHAEAETAKKEAAIAEGEVLKIRRREEGFSLVLYTKIGKPDVKDSKTG